MRERSSAPPSFIRLSLSLKLEKAKAFVLSASIASAAQREILSVKKYVPSLVQTGKWIVPVKHETSGVEKRLLLGVGLRGA